MPVLTPSELCLRALKIFDEAWRSDPTFTEEKEFFPFPVKSHIKEQFSVGFFFPEGALELPLQNFADKWLYTAVNRLVSKMPAISTLVLDPPGQRLEVRDHDCCAVESSHGVRMRVRLAEQPILSMDIPGSWGKWGRAYNLVYDMMEFRHVGMVMRIDVRAIRKAAGE